jgi:hypothetical protein
MGSSSRTGWSWAAEWREASTTSTAGTSARSRPLRQRSGRSVVEIVAEELGPSVRRATATTRSTPSQDR